MNNIFYPQSLTQVSTDIFHTKFLTPKFAKIVVDILKESDLWTKGSYDRSYSTHDIQLKKHFPDLYELIKEQFDNIVLREMYDIWFFNGQVQVDSIFAVKYSKETQIRLREHIDESCISGSIKLNTDYEGGVLKFNRQNFTNDSMEIGDLIIWPSQITHPHLSTELVDGEKYSLTIWTDAKNNS
tara:strand:+ start:2127 stop:2678 length:552 start_codon:yes stop_codon:yes gene_type:complete